MSHENIFLKRCGIGIFSKNVIAFLMGQVGVGVLKKFFGLPLIIVIIIMIINTFRFHQYFVVESTIKYFNKKIYKAPQLPVTGRINGLPRWLFGQAAITR